MNAGALAAAVMEELRKAGVWAPSWAVNNAVQVALPPDDNPLAIMLLLLMVAIGVCR